MSKRNGMTLSLEIAGTGGSPNYFDTKEMNAAMRKWWAKPERKGAKDKTRTLRETIHQQASASAIKSKGRA